MKSKLSKKEVEFIKKMAKKYGYKYSKAKRLFLKGELEETITTTSSGVAPGGTGEFKSRFGAVKYLRQKLK